MPYCPVGSMWTGTGLLGGGTVGCRTGWVRTFAAGRSCHVCARWCITYMVGVTAAPVIAAANTVQATAGRAKTGSGWAR